MTSPVEALAPLHAADRAARISASDLDLCHRRRSASMRVSLRAWIHGITPSGEHVPPLAGVVTTTRHSCSIGTGMKRYCRLATSRCGPGAGQRDETGMGW
jgi:hypothetical protein